MHKLREAIKYIIFIIVAAVIIYAGWKISEWFIDKQIKERTALILPDTLVIERLKTEFKIDTVIKWHEVPFYKESEPRIIYVQSDSLIKKDLENKDLIISLKKENDELKIFTHNKNDSLVKEYKFNGVGKDFSATAIARNVFVKSQRFYWEGVNANIDFEINMNNLNEFKEINSYNKSFGLSTGFSYNEMIELDFGARYNINLQDYFLFTKLNYKIFK